MMNLRHSTIGTHHLDSLSCEVFWQTLINIDAQDAQDERDESLLHEKPAPAMIACGFADAQDYKLAVS